MRAASVVAQCKVNLFLRVLAREVSGYHQLETVFARLSLGDVVTVRTDVATRSLDVSGPAVPREGLGPVERNLAWRAAVAFAEETALPKGFAIEVEKRIPVGGGLGGGSADAGAVLRILNALAPNPLNQRQLLRIAAALGADVPVLTQDDSPLALAWGRGDRLLTLPPLPARNCELIVFPFGVSTPDAFRWFSEAAPASAGCTLLSLAALSSWDSLDALAYNDFEHVVLPRFPVIDEALRCLRDDRKTDTPSVSLMSGSGATVFRLTAVRDPSESGVEEASSEHGFGGTIVRTLTALSVEPVRVLD